MEFIEQVKLALKQMEEDRKDEWILNRARLCKETEREDFLTSLSGKKKSLALPDRQEIDRFCQTAGDGELSVEYETHYYEFDSGGRYMDDWEYEYHLPDKTVSILNRVYQGCCELVRLGEYEEAAEILGKISGLIFKIETAEESEDCAEQDEIGFEELTQEGLFCFSEEEWGDIWVRAEFGRRKDRTAKEQAARLVELLETPICRKIKPEVLLEEGMSQEVLFHMESYLKAELAHRGKLKEKMAKDQWSRTRYLLEKEIERNRELLLEIRLKCRKDQNGEAVFSGGLLEIWDGIRERLDWLGYQPKLKGHAEGLPEFEYILKGCEALIKSEKLPMESWKNRERILDDVVDHGYFARYGCRDAMKKLSEKLCFTKEEHLARAEKLSRNYEQEEAAYLYYQYGRDDKYLEYLEGHLSRGCKEYNALIAYYESHGQREEARRVAERGLECCKEDLTEIFIFLLKDAKKEKDTPRYQKLYASAKRRKKVDIIRVNIAVTEE